MTDWAPGRRTQQRCVAAERVVAVGGDESLAVLSLPCHVPGQTRKWGGIA